MNPEAYVELRKGRGATVRRVNGGWQVTCPAHEDRTPSLAVTSGREGRVLLHCHAGCQLGNILAADGLEVTDLFDGRRNGRVEVALYPYVDERGVVLFEVGRFEPKDFLQRRPGRADWRGGIKGVRRVLYRLPKVLEAIAAGAAVYVVEGEKDVHAIERAGAVATCNPMGAGRGKWKAEYSETLRGADVIVVADRDDEGREHARRVAVSLRGAARSVEVVEAAAGKDAADHLAAGRSLEELVPIELDAADAAEAKPAEEAVRDVEPRTLEQVVATYRQWLHLPDARALLVVLGAVAANLLDGDPVWLVIVAAGSSGKSELLVPTRALPFVHPAATLTEAALLSGVPKREQSSSARGGLLRSLGDFGVLLCKDFGSVLSMDRAERARVLGALREVYDGSWTRHVGSEGGKRLHWEGKAGLIAGATPTLDRHHAVMSAMGERFLLYRLPATDPITQARVALTRGRARPMSELRAAVAGLFCSDLPEPRPLEPTEVESLIKIATLAAVARSSVERDSYSREIELIPESEAPARLAQQLAQLLHGLDVIGVDRATAHSIVRKAALDSIPTLRRRAIMALARAGELDTAEIAARIQYPTGTTRRALEDLTGHGVTIRRATERGKAHRWELATWALSDLSRNVGEPARSPADTAFNSSSNSQTTTKREGSSEEGQEAAGDPEVDRAERLFERWGDDELEEAPPA